MVKCVNLFCDPITVEKGTTLKSVANSLGVSKTELIRELREKQPEVLGKNAEGGFFLKRGEKIFLKKEDGDGFGLFSTCRIASSLWKPPMQSDLDCRWTKDVLPKAVTALQGKERWITVQRGDEIIKFRGKVVDIKNEAGELVAKLSIPKGTTGFVVGKGGGERTMLTDETFTLGIRYFEKTGDGKLVYDRSSYPPSKTVFDDHADITPQKKPFKLDY